MFRITLVAGARPNFIKIAPIVAALDAKIKEGEPLRYRLVHTGQHYDEKMSQRFFDDLEIHPPDINLGAGGGTQAEQTAAIMIGFEKELLTNPADVVVVVGDVTSTLACSIVSKKERVLLAHVEAGIRSFDLTMPEEINRMVTDSITDFFFTTSAYATENLLNIGVPRSSIYFVGNVMIDTLLAHRHRFRPPTIWTKEGLQPKKFVVLTLHRPSNVDSPIRLAELLATITSSLPDLPIIFPVHPRTRQSLKEIQELPGNLRLCEPMGYLEFNYLVDRALGVITDSGGITEETTVLNIPCITLRDSTERPETVHQGTNELVGNRLDELKKYLELMRQEKWKKGHVPDLWDGNSARRIVDSLCQALSLKNSLV